MEKYSQLESSKYIPLKDYTKVSSVKWGTDEEFTVDDNVSYAIDTGRSNLVVVDCDNKNDQNGVQNFLNQALEFEGIPQTLTVETPNDGLHFYFKAPKEYLVKSSAGTVLGEGIDIRANGGYIVAPGSKLKTEDGSIKDYRVEDQESEIAELPQWILQKIKSHTVKKDVKPVIEYVDDDVSDREEVDRKAALEWALAKMGQAIEGTRQETLNSLSYFMGRKRVEQYKAEQLIHVSISAGLPKNEAESTFNHGYSDGLKEEEISYDVLVKSYNAKNNISIKEDPLDTGFYTHISLSYNFWKEYSERFLFHISSMKWYEYNELNGCWVCIEEQNIKNTVKVFLDELVNKIRENNKNIRPNVYSMQEKLWTKSTIESVTAVTRSDFTNYTENLFDNNPYLINCANGVLDIKNNKILKHSPKFFITNYIPVNYNPDATDKYCDAVIESLHPEEKDYVQLIVGQSLLGFQPNYQAAYFLQGRGSNGKSTFIDLLLKTSGSYGKLQPPNIFIPEKNSDSYALADFEGLRVAIIEELPDSKHLNSGALKRLVGTRNINARAIYSKNREFENQSTIFITCNRLPMINETDEGTWRRLLVFKFPYTYKKNASQIKGEFDRVGDPRVLYSAQNKKTTAEAFLSWRIAGAQRWINNNRVEYDIPRHIEETVEEWNENNDLFLAWFNENFELNPNSFITTTDLLNSFNEWTKKRNNATISARYFNETLKNHKVYYDNNLNIKSNSRILQGMRQSVFRSDDFNYNNSYYSPGDRCTYITGISFK